MRQRQVQRDVISDTSRSITTCSRNNIERETQLKSDIAQDLEGLKRRLSSLANPEDRERATAFAAELLAAENPMAARQWVSELAAEGRGEAAARAVAMLEVAKQGAQRSGCVVWADSLPAGAARAAALRTGMEGWLADDPAAARLWMAEQIAAGRHADRDGAIAAAVHTVSLSQPVEALAWTRWVEEPTLQTLLLEETAQHWAAQDRSGLANYLSSNPPPPLSPQERSILSQHLNPPLTNDTQIHSQPAPHSRGSL
jgi:hypothetical protein